MANTTADVIVVGLGAHGSAAAWQRGEGCGVHANRLRTHRTALEFVLAHDASGPFPRLFFSPEATRAMALVFAIDVDKPAPPAAFALIHIYLALFELFIHPIQSDFNVSN